MERSAIPVGVERGATPGIGSDSEGPRSEVSPWRIDYHLHTCRSYDCDTPFDAVVSKARAARLSHVCVTDHETIDGALALLDLAPSGLEIIVGCEFDLEDGSQVIGIGLERLPTERRPLHLLEQIRAGGGLVLLPHPYRRGTGIFRPERRCTEAFVREVLDATDLVECFNGHDSYDNNLRNRRLMEERGLAGVAGSDAHTPDEIGSVLVEYPGTDVVHGRSTRTIWHTDRPAHREHPLKRRAMESYHRHEARLPGPVVRAYRASRAAVGRERHAGRGGVARLQYEVPAVGVTSREA